MGKGRDGTTLKQKAFVRSLIKHKFNGTQAVLETYDTTDPRVAGSISAENLIKPSIQQEIKRQLEASGLSPSFSDASLKHIIEAGLANKDRATPADALSAIKEVNALLDRYPAKQTIVAGYSLSLELQGKSIAELQALASSKAEEMRLLSGRLGQAEPV